MKKLVSVLVAFAMCACFCLPAFALDSLKGLGDLDLKNIDISSIASGIDLDGLKDTLSGIIGGSSDSSTTTGAESGAISKFDPTGVLAKFTQSLDLSQITQLFSGLTDALGSLGIKLPDSSSASSGFDITGILGGNSGSNAGVASIMDSFGSVLEKLGLDSAVIESLGQSDIVNFFANLYMGSVSQPETTTEATTTTTTEKVTVEEEATTKPHNPEMGVNDGAAVVAACATLSVAAAAVYVCTRKKHA